jgi:hypothetical protein
LLFFRFLPFIIKSITPLTKLYSTVKEFKDRKILTEKLSRGAYDKETIEQSTKYYISPKCSNIDPAQEEEIRQALMATRESLFDKIDYFLDHDSSKRHLLILADSGTGKTSFVLNPSVSFGVVSGFEDSLPIIGYRSMTRNATTPAKFWTRECTFSVASFWRKKDYPQLKYMIFGTDVFITCLGMEAGFSFLHPSTKICFYNQVNSTSLWNDSIKQIQSKSAFDEVQRSLKKLGMFREVSREARMGIVDEKDENEIITKYGSRAEYMYLASYN